MPQDFIVAKFSENGNEWESFVWKPRKPSCLAADGSCDYAKLNVLIEKAKAGDEKATMLVFEQYQGLWKKIIAEFKGKFEEYAYDYEDLQQEAFLALLVALGKHAEKDLAVFAEFYGNILRNNLIETIRKGNKLINAKCFLCSIDARDEEGNLIYDIPVDCENDYFSNYYPQVRALLTEREFQVVITHYVDGIPLGTIAKEMGISYRTIKNIVRTTKEKLKVLDK